MLQQLYLLNIAEYFSTKCLNFIQIFNNKNIISLGGNQAYYKIQVSNNFQTIECRKDGTSLDNTLIPWRKLAYTISSEAKYWGQCLYRQFMKLIQVIKYKMPIIGYFKIVKIKMVTSLGNTALMAEV